MKYEIWDYHKNVWPVLRSQYKKELCYLSHKHNLLNLKLPQFSQITKRKEIRLTVMMKHDPLPRGWFICVPIYFDLLKTSCNNSDYVHTFNMRTVAGNQFKWKFSSWKINFLLWPKNVFVKMTLRWSNNNVDCNIFCNQINIIHL